jgi:vacuolar-type H+-ATPase subunit I/STV1
MTPHKRFFLGGGGALMPVLVSFLAIDIGAALGDDENLTTANIIGIGIRYMILFIVGGFVAYLHEDELKPFKLFELGIAAPALITSLITAQAVAAQPSPPSQSSYNISFISSAHAATIDSEREPLILAWSLGDVFDGASGKAYQKISRPIERTVQDTEKTVEKAVQDTGKTIEKAAQDVDKRDPKVSEEQKQEEHENKLLEAKAEAARSKALAESAKAKAEALEKEYQASLAIAEAAEAQVIAAELEIELLHKNHAEKSSNN